MHRCSGKGSPAKRTAWKWFSLYIRLRDCLKTTGGTDYCKCATCGVVVPFEKIDAGHAIPGRTAGILFDDEITRGQCTTCNRTHGGEYQAFKTVLIAEHGEAWYDMKLKARRGAGSFAEFELRAIADKYRLKCKELEKHYTSV